MVDLAASPFGTARSCASSSRLASWNVWIIRWITVRFANGFVFSTAEIDEYIRRKDSLDAAQRTIAMAPGNRVAA